MEQYKRIAVIGGTGKAGTYLVNELISRGYSIKVLLRNPDRFEIDNHLAEKVPGNVNDYDSVYNLIKDCDAVISALGQPKGEKPVFSQATSHIIRAMANLNVRRYIMITGLTLDTARDRKSFRTKLLSGIMKLFFPAICADKQKEYTLLSESNLEWTMVRLPLIERTQNTGEMKISLYNCPGKKISSTDLADFLVSQLDDKTFIREAPFVANGGV
jgi:putative NADH-flavin reductase